MKMKINCATCDARNVTEETLAAYEQIEINCAMVTVTPEAKALMNRYAVTLNCASVLEVAKDVRLTFVNGHAQISPTDRVAEKTFLQVNGSLEIAAGAEKQLEQYVGILVNGSVQYPESMSACLGNLKLNGSAFCYPDGAVVLKRNAVIDRTFALRAKNKLYWSGKRMVMVDPALDPEALKKRGATFSSKEVILAEGKVESILDCIDEQAEIIIVPDGTRVVMDDVELNETAVKRYGSKLYIIGDVEISGDGGAALEKLEYLHVQGDVKVPEVLKDLLLEKAEIKGDIQISKSEKSRTLEDRPFLKISKWMLEREAIHVEDCGKVRLDEDISRELILEKLTISDCEEVICTPEQEDALSMVCEDVGSIGSEAEGGLGDMLKGVAGGVKELLDTKVINAAEYVL